MTVGGVGLADGLGDGVGFGRDVGCGVEVEVPVPRRPPTVLPSPDTVLPRRSPAWIRG
jgi:hypothetical protein